MRPQSSPGIQTGRQTESSKSATRPPLPTPPPSFRPSFSAIDSSQDETYMEGDEGSTTISWPIVLAVIPTLGAFFAGSAEIWSDFVISLLILYYVYKWMTGKYSILYLLFQEFHNLLTGYPCSSLVAVRGSPLKTHYPPERHSQTFFFSCDKAVICSGRATSSRTSWTLLGHCIALHCCLLSTLQPLSVDKSRTLSYLFQCRYFCIGSSDQAL